MKVTANSRKKLPIKAGSSSAKSRDATSKKSAQEIILELAAESYSLGNETLPRSRLTMGTGLATKTVINNLAKLKQKGLIEYPDPKTIKLTQEGVNAVGTLANLPKTNADRHECIKKNLKGKHINLFDLLLDGNIHDKNAIANALGYDSQKTKGFVNLIGAMRSQGLVEYPDKQTVKLSDICFPFGRDSSAPSS
jgi:predicted transcriptional regulator